MAAHAVPRETQPWIHSCTFIQCTARTAMYTSFSKKLTKSGIFLGQILRSTRGPLFSSREATLNSTQVCKTFHSSRCEVTKSLWACSQRGKICQFAPVTKQQICFKLSHSQIAWPPQVDLESSMILYFSALEGGSEHSQCMHDSIVRPRHSGHWNQLHEGAAEPRTAEQTWLFVPFVLKIFQLPADFTDLTSASQQHLNVASPCSLSLKSSSQQSEMTMRYFWQGHKLVYRVCSKCLGPEKGRHKTTHW